MQVPIEAFFFDSIDRVLFRDANADHFTGRRDRQSLENRSGRGRKRCVATDSHGNHSERSERAEEGKVDSEGSDGNGFSESSLFLRVERDKSTLNERFLGEIQRFSHLYSRLHSRDGGLDHLLLSVERVNVLEHEYLVVQMDRQFEGGVDQQRHCCGISQSSSRIGRLLHVGRRSR